MVQQQLVTIRQDCLDSAEFFALLGAAQLNLGQVNESLESLERALLLDPANGAAQIDYAQVLFEQGQLFSALEMNRQLLERSDLPANLMPALSRRQQEWQGLTAQTSWQLEGLIGYDSNLNGAPDPSQITLTLSGESVILTLSPEYQAVSGPYANLRIGGRHRRLAPEYQHNLLLDVRGRVSESTESDLLQVDGRYAFIRPDRDAGWQLDTGLSHLFFGGSSLYSAAEGRLRFLGTNGRRCRPYYGLALQYQYYHGQSNLNAAETKASVGLNCPYGSAFGNHLVSLEASLLGNLALDNLRPGGDRHGWQLGMDWQLQLARGELRTQLNYTRLDDREAYNPLLDNGADRWLNRSYVLFQYRLPFSGQLTFLTNMYYQLQDSNIGLFETRDSAIELGLSLGF